MASAQLSLQPQSQSKPGGTEKERLSRTESESFEGIGSNLLELNSPSFLLRASVSPWLICFGCGRRRAEGIPSVRGSLLCCRIIARRYSKHLSDPVFNTAGWTVFPDIHSYAEFADSHVYREMYLLVAGSIYSGDRGIVF